MTSHDDVQKARNLHADAIHAFTEAANDLAEAEFDYDIKRGAMTSALREADTPITIIDKLVKGNERVAEAKRRVAVCEGVKKTAEFRVQATYNDWKQAQAYEERDWRQGGYGDYGA